MELSWEDTVGVLHELTSIYLSNDDINIIQNINQKVKVLNKYQENDQNKNKELIKSIFKIFF